MPKPARPARAVAAAFVLAAVLLTLPTAGFARASHQQAFAGTIAFLRWPPGAVDYSTGPSLYVVRADGSGLRRLTPGGTSVYTYAWSPDGKLIAYTDQQLSLWLVRPDGAGRKLLLPSSQLSSLGLSWSPDSQNIAIVSPGPNANPRTAVCSKLTLYVVPISGNSPSSLAGGRDFCDVAWSPRGDEIAYTANGPARGGTRAIRPDGTGDRRILNVAVGGLQWSADGGQLAFGAVIHLRSGLTDRYRAFAVVNADGTGYHLVTTHAYTEYGVAWSPQGRRILYGRGDHKGIYVIGSDGRGNRRVTRDSPPLAGWGALAWSPNGGSIIYTTGGTDDTDLYLIGIDGRGKVQLTNTPDIDIAPSWVAR